jgi:hypothetical protein
MFDLVHETGNAPGASAQGTCITMTYARVLPHQQQRIIHCIIQGEMALQCGRVGSRRDVEIGLIILRNSHPEKILLWEEVLIIRVKCHITYRI